MKKRRFGRTGLRAITLLSAVAVGGFVVDPVQGDSWASEVRTIIIEDDESSTHPKSHVLELDLSQINTRASPTVCAVYGRPGNIDSPDLNKGSVNALIELLRFDSDSNELRVVEKKRVKGKLKNGGFAGCTGFNAEKGDRLIFNFKFNSMAKLTPEGSSGIGIIGKAYHQTGGGGHWNYFPPTYSLESTQVESRLWVSKKRKHPRISVVEFSMPTEAREGARICAHYFNSLKKSNKGKVKPVLEITRYDRASGETRVIKRKNLESKKVRNNRYSSCTTQAVRAGDGIKILFKFSRFSKINPKKSDIESLVLFGKADPLSNPAPAGSIEIVERIEPPGVFVIGRDEIAINFRYSCADEAGCDTLLMALGNNFSFVPLAWGGRNLPMGSDIVGTVQMRLLEPGTVRYIELVLRTESDFLPLDSDSIATSYTFVRP